MAWKTPKTWSTGDFVVAADMNEEIRNQFNEVWKGTTAGDIDYYASSTSKSRLGIGSANNVLVVSGGVPAWSGPIGCQVQKLAAQAIGNDSLSDITSYSQENFDYGGWFTSGNSLTVPVGYGGVYFIQARGYWDSDADNDTLREISVKIAGTVRHSTTFCQTDGTEAIWQEATFVRLLSAGETITMSVLQKSGGNLNFNQAVLTAMLWR